MIILSYKDGHDPAAALLKDGQIIAAAAEERFNREKHSPAKLPVQSIQFCLEQAGISPNQVDHLVYARRKNIATAWSVLTYYLRHIPRNNIERKYAISHGKAQVKGAVYEMLGKARWQQVHKHFPSLPKKVHSFDHHFLHAASAYYFSDMQEATVVTWDGKGEATSVLICKGKENALRPVLRRGIFSSLGLFYSAITKYLGFTPNDGEYKVMGLAPYGKTSIDFSEILRPEKKTGYEINSRYSLYPLSEKNLEKKFGPVRTRESKLEQKHFDIAASAQKALEDAGLSFIRFAVEKAGSKNLCIAGGVGLNIKMNKLVQDSGIVDKLFVQPAAGDDGLVLGACAHMYTQLTGKRVAPLKHLYLGPEFSDEQIENALRQSGLAYSRSQDIKKDVVSLLLEKKVVGWFQGRMEFGPRALGSRSILADPRHKKMKDEVNLKIKFRESFRPFCPSVLTEQAPNLFKNYTHAPYMVTAFDIKSQEVAEKIPAVVHVDNTLRPQAVEEQTNPLYHQLISEFYSQSGVPVVLNTSMNVRGEPIVCTPKDGIEFFKKTHADALAIGPFLLKKEDQDADKLTPLSRQTLKTKY